MCEYFRDGLDRYDVSPSREKNSTQDVSKQIISFGIGSHDVLHATEQDGVSVLKSE